MSQCWTCSHVSRHATAPGDGVGVCRDCNGLACSGHGVVDATLDYFVCYLCVANAVAGTGHRGRGGGGGGGGGPAGGGPDPGDPGDGGGDSGGSAADAGEATGLAALGRRPLAEAALRYRGLVATARDLLPRAVRVRDAVALVGELRAVLHDGHPAGLPAGERLDWAIALGLAALSEPGSAPTGVLPPGDAGDAMVRLPVVMGLSYVMALDPEGTQGALWPWYEEVDAPWVTLGARLTLVADVASGVLAELGVEAAEPTGAELAQAQREVAELPGPLAGLDLGEVRSHRAVVLASAVRGMPMGGALRPVQ
jgi:hypothetical protein